MAWPGNAVNGHARYAGAYHHGVSTQQRAGAVTVTAGAAVLLVGTFLTWLRSGATERSSYDVFDLVDRLGFSEGGLWDGHYGCGRWCRCCSCGR